MNAISLNLLRLLACLCVGASLLSACAGSSGAVYVPSAKSCDPTGDADARRACNR